MFILNNKNNLRSVFTIRSVVTRFTKIDIMLICFYKKIRLKVNSLCWYVSYRLKKHFSVQMSWQKNFKLISYNLVMYELLFCSQIKNLARSIWCLVTLLEVPSKILREMLLPPSKNKCLKFDKNWMYLYIKHV